jgi:hypothetical protein
VATLSLLENPLAENLMKELTEWIPERMDPGTVFVLPNPNRFGPENNRFVAAVSCPKCAAIGLITRRQLCGSDYMICGGEACSNEWHFEGEKITGRAPQ